MITRYDAASDDLVPVDQSWCDVLQTQVGLLAMQREIIRAVSGMNVVKQAEDVREIWNFLRRIGLAATIAEAADEQRRQKEISEAINAGLNASTEYYE